ncbi:odorant receptor Or1-like [Culicoides brevitarsis]|uniref:odorant receptor Or1-like n=1 Tax=Culicoides brevitarsis TaxID=469753 RepID=UPI00307BD045
MGFLTFDPRNPLSNFDMHILGLKICGLLPPDDKKKRFLYEIYSWFLVIFFLYLFIVSQIFYLATAKDLDDFANALYFFLTELVTIPMHFQLKKSIKVATDCIEKLSSARFLSQNDVEDGFVAWAMIRTTLFHRPSVGLCFLCLFQWSVALFLSGNEQNSIVPAVFPFNFEAGFGFYAVWVYQLLGAGYSAVLYATFDTLVTGIYFHATAQINRLGYHLSQIGYQKKQKSDSKGKNGVIIVKKAPPADRQEQIKEELIDSAIHYQEILTYCENFIETFQLAIFIQLGVSLFVLCFTLFLIMNVADGDIMASTNILPYFVTIVYQLWQLSYTGNELSHASNKLSDAIYFANFLEFNVKNRKLMLLFMTRTMMPIKVTAKACFEIVLDIETFIAIMRASYSYCSVMKSVQGN